MGGRRRRLPARELHLLDFKDRSQGGKGEGNFAANVRRITDKEWEKGSKRPLSRVAGLDFTPEIQVLSILYVVLSFLVTL